MCNNLFTKEILVYFILILLSSLCICITSHAEVYDCFPFFNELELLKVRLAELDNYVDYFVLVESIETQRGDFKPLYFQENRHLFEKYLHKIIHVIVEQSLTTNSIVDHFGRSWDRENFQRECITRGLQDCDDLDIILISDLDEIPLPECIERVKPLLYRNKYRQVKTAPYSVAFDMPLFIFQLNRTSSILGGRWVGTVATLYRNVKKKGIQLFRDRRHSFFRVKNGGWHFTWMGGKEKIRQKLLSVVEGIEREEVDIISDEELELWMQSNPFIPIDSAYPNDFPRYIRNNIDYFRSIGFIAE